MSRSDWCISLKQLATKRGQKAFASWAGETVLIWSREWGLWWRPNGSGYTSKFEDAGRYRFEDAYGRTCHCGPEKGIEYHRDISI